MGFFKAYDMRGTFGVDFDLETVYQVGRALPGVVAKGRWLVGRDCRTTSADVRDALVAGLSDAGVEVTDLGPCTTPMVYFFTAEDGYDGSVMITASHNPPSDNGLKVSKATALPVGYANGLGEVEAIVKREGQRPRTPRQQAYDSKKECGEERQQAYDSKIGCGEERQQAYDSKIGCGGWSLARYVAWQKERAPKFDGLKFAVDCSNGMASILAHAIFEGAVFINDTLDGTFPNHSPNPLKDEAREQIAAVVREQGLDCGVIFDGDADRAMFVDERGEFVQPDYLVPVVARGALGERQQAYDSKERQQAYDSKIGCGKERQQAYDSKIGFGGKVKVIHDVRTSRGAIEAIREMGCEPVMVPVGHAFAKPILRQVGAVCGGELAGHYYFGEFHGCDSGVLAATRVLGEIAKAKARGLSFSQMMAPITTRYANSGEINFKVDDKEAAIARALAVAGEKLPREIGRETMDGIRIEYAEGWINIRKSNTEPYLRLIAECDTRARLDAWLALLKGAIAG